MISDSLLFPPPPMIIMSARPQSLSYHVSGSVKWGGGRKMLWWERAWFGLVWLCVHVRSGPPLVGTDKYLPPLLSSSSSVFLAAGESQAPKPYYYFFSCSAQNWPLYYGTRYNVLPFYYHGWKCDGGTVGRNQLPLFYERAALFYVMKPIFESNFLFSTPTGPIFFLGNRLFVSWQKHPELLYVHRDDVYCIRI